MLTESLAAKGLILHAMGKKAEGEELARAGIRAKLSSPTVWHVWALMKQSDGDRVEALKAFARAHKLHPENFAIMHGLAALQLQMRDISGFAANQRALIAGGSGTGKPSWAGFVLAEHALGHTDVAIAILSVFQASQASNARSTVTKKEASELVMYKAAMMEHVGDYEAALNELSVEETKIVHKTAAAERRARLLTLSGKQEEARAAWKTLLITVNPNEPAYHRGYQATVLGASTPDALGSSQAAPRARPADATAPRPTVSFPPMYPLLPGGDMPASQLAVAGGSTRVTRAGLALQPHMVSPLSDEQCAALLAAYAELPAQARLVQRLPLLWLTPSHPEWQERVSTYVDAAAARGVPSLAQDLKDLATKPATSAAYGALLQELLVTAKAAFSGADSADSAAYRKAGSKAAWLTAYSADYARRTGDLDTAAAQTAAALELAAQLNGTLSVEEAEAGRAAAAAELGTPATVSTVYVPPLRTVVDPVPLWQLQARVLKAQGSLSEAADVLNQAREFDAADRYINSKCAKYMARAGRLTEAREVIGLFAREDKDPMSYILDLGHLWYELEVAEAALKLGNLGLALKRFNDVLDLFKSWLSEESDFFAYSMRRLQLSAYHDFLQWTDSLPRHPLRLRALAGAIAAYRALAESPDRVPLLTAVLHTEEELAAMPSAQRKRAKAAAKKAATKATQQAEELAALQPVKDKQDKVQDNDLEGRRFLFNDDPLADAVTLAHELLRHVPAGFVESPDMLLTAARAFAAKDRACLVASCVARIRSLGDAGAAQLAEAQSILAALDLTSAPAAVAQALAAQP